MGGMLGLGGCATMPGKAPWRNRLGLNYEDIPPTLAPDPRPSRPHLRHHAAACGRSGSKAPTWIPSRSATPWSSTITAMAAAAGRCPGARPISPSRRPCRSAPKEIAVIGCGIVGLTAAILAQRAGAKVTIYAREVYSRTRSVRANGSWTPDSRISPDRAGRPGTSAPCGKRWRAFLQVLPLLYGPAGPAGGLRRPYRLSDTPRQPPRRKPDPAISASYATTGMPQQNAEFGATATASATSRPGRKFCRKAPRPFPSNMSRATKSCSSTSPPTAIC